MSTTKVLLLHGPLNSVGINLISQHIPTTAEGRRDHWFPYHCQPNIIALSQVFRQLGYGVVYSGWNDDSEWLEANRGLFDGLILSDQSHLKSEDRLGATVYPNNKDKLFYSVAQGLREVQRLYGEDAIVMRLRSDCAVKAELVQAEMDKAEQEPGVMVVEYLNTDRMLMVPDFMMVARAGVMHAMYHEMFERSIHGNAYHISSHMDISLTLIGMRQQGRLSGIHTMSRALFDSLVWRGLPRYLEETLFPNVLQAFDCSMNVPPGFDLAGEIAKYTHIVQAANASAGVSGTAAA
jgi:hypothetical protein